MTREPFRIALVSEVFPELDDEPRLIARLEDVAERGARLAILPELPLNGWAPATPDRDEGDSEEVGGPRELSLRAAAQNAGVAVIGGHIVLDPSGRRFNEALLVNASGEVVLRYWKAHLPDEPGFHEVDHYEPGDRSPGVARWDLAVGVQVCSDVNRPEGTHLLAALGAELVACPRATEAKTWDRWRTVLVANAMTSCVWVASVNRPAPECGVLLGGPSLLVAPDGEVVVESDQTVVISDLDRERLAQARLGYPGYLPVRDDLYAAGWGAVSSGI